MILCLQLLQSLLFVLEFWYKGEIGFFDFYIIPLSKKLRDCGVFGPTSEENLNYAIGNRNTWEREGEQVTEELHKRAEAEYQAQLAKRVVKGKGAEEEMAKGAEEEIQFEEDLV